MHLKSEAWKLSKASRISRRSAIAMFMAVSIMVFGPDEALARGLKGGAISGGGGGSGTDITAFQILTTDATNIAANSIFEFGMPLAVGTLDSTKALQIVDSGNSVVGYVQEDNRAIDLTGTAVRMLKCTGSIITAPGANNKALKLQYITGTPVTSNPISVANLLAQTISGDTYETKVTCTFPNGDVYTALATDALQASSTWAYGSAQNRGTHRSGPLCTEWICSAPLVKSGPTAHAFLNAQFHISAYKAAPGAWDAITNPIVSVKTVVVLENGYTLSSPQDLVYDLLIQSGASSLTTVYQLNGSSPAVTLTLGAVSGPTSATLSAGTWATANTLPNSQDGGKALVEIGGTGIGYIMYCPTTATANVSIPADRPFAGTSKTSGNWKKMGVYHCYTTRVTNYMFPAWWGTQQKTVAALPYSHLRTSQMFINYAGEQTSAGAPDLTNVNLDGAHPCGMTYNGSTQLIKNFKLGESNTGDTNAIGILSYDLTAALMNWTYSDGNHLTARDLCLKESQVGNQKPFWQRDSSHGGLISIDQAGVYYRTGKPNNGVGLDANSYVGACLFEFALNHSGQSSDLAYKTTGDFMFLEGLAMECRNYSMDVGGLAEFATTTATLANGSANITVSSAALEQTGEAVVLQWSGFTPQIGGVNASRANMYFINRVNSTTVNLYDTHAHAVAGGVTGKVTFSSAGTGVVFRNGYQKTAMTTGENGNQARAVAWNLRTIAQALMSWPSTITAGLVDYSSSRANFQRQLDTLGTWMKTLTVDDSNFVAGGPRYIEATIVLGNVYALSPWQSNYLRLALIHAQEGGTMNAAWLAVLDWFLADQTEWATRTSDSSPFASTTAYYFNITDNSDVIGYTYSDAYQNAMRTPINSPVQARGWGTFVQSGQSATIASVANQAAVTVALNLNFFDVGTSAKHIGQWIIVGNGCGQVTSVIDAKTCVLDTTVATFGGIATGNGPLITGAGQAVTMPLLNPANANTIAGSNYLYSGSNQDHHYCWLASSGLEIARQRNIGNSNYTAARSYFDSTIAMPSNSPPSHATVLDCPSALKANVKHR